MGNGGERHFGLGPAIELVKKRLGRANPTAASVEGPELTPTEVEEQHLISLPGTKRHADAARGDIPFDRDEHRKRRGLR
ncbi:MAG: hypothetical protein UT84_C0003G0061 [Candidatus Curtissbacteria bacterium GW2011_GWA1_40_16]|uniref:Uncharacterized protein n=1 Tax=Candidatus Curtissbacteria bacterium GW2011_GWA1_40_16 TaxID=1618405 RepID=A0A0G0RMD8_9BACT|nr:MAG: hypothetical protein UT84_C0003G0061 [Candidatus Curtissbacteria bacterium GW2011_GWA1_40_16]